MQQVEFIKIFEGSLPKIKEVRNTLATSGINVRITNPTENCKSGGWGTKYWLAVASHDLEEVKVILAPKTQAPVIDFNAEEMTCPACTTTFATGPRECPDCGLFLG